MVIGVVLVGLVLNCFELCVLFDGVVVVKYLLQGEVVQVEIVVFMVVDLCIVWVDFFVIVKDLEVVIVNVLVIVCVMVIGIVV